MVLFAISSSCSNFTIFSLLSFRASVRVETLSSFSSLFSAKKVGICFGESPVQWSKSIASKGAGLFDFGSDTLPAGGSDVVEGSVSDANNAPGDLERIGLADLECIGLADLERIE